MFKNIKLENVKGILLDLDNTLYEYEPCHLHALDSCYEKMKEYKDNITLPNFILEYKNAQELVKIQLGKTGSSHSRFLHFQRLIENVFGRTNVRMTVAFEKKYWDSFFSKMLLRSDAIDFLKECRLKGIKVCLVTDLTAKIQFEKLIHLKIDQYIDFIISSEEAGQDKPDSQIFKMALNKVCLKSEDVLMIGDSEKNDILGARKMNIRAVLMSFGENLTI